MFRFSVNGTDVSVVQDVKLLRFLRDELRLTSVKNGCSQGACGTCMVIVDGKAVKACVLRLSKLVGKSIITVEGFSEREKAVYSRAFAVAGAVQCGFCTPGMVISAKALLDACPDPSLEQVRVALKNNICRCTGYKKIEQAVLNAARMLRKSEDLGEKSSFDGYFGDFSGGGHLPRIDAEAKVLGVAEYCDDIYIDGMIFGGAVRLPCARARINSIDVREAMALEGVVASVTADDLPGVKKIGHIKKDWDVLIAVGGETHTIGDAVVLIAAKSREVLAEAKKLVRIDYDELVPITCPQESMAVGASCIQDGGNLLAAEHIVRGNADAKIAESVFCVTEHYSTPFTEHAFLETETAVCVPGDIDFEGNVGSLVIYSGDQGVYQTQKECAEAAGLSVERVRVVAKAVGGGFGGKEDMSVQHHAAILARICGFPVKMSLSRQESIMVHSKRHAMEIDMTTACDKNGKLTAMKAKIIADTGAYASLGAPVLQRACTHAAGPYNYQDIDIVGEGWYTNNPPAGAFRGFGVTQSCFAIEQNLNLLAKKVGISPWEIRRRNAIECGQCLPNGQIADENTAFIETLEAVKPYYDAHPKAGVACAMKNSGIGVGLPDVGRCRLVVRGGKVHVHSSAACIGQGMGTVIVQMLCKTARIAPSFVVYEPPDTAHSPNSGNTTASRQTVFTGEATCRAATQLKVAMDEVQERSFRNKKCSVSDENFTSMNNPVSSENFTSEDGLGCCERLLSENSSICSENITSEGSLGCGERLLSENNPVLGENITSKGDLGCGKGLLSENKPVSGENITSEGSLSCGVNFVSTNNSVCSENITSEDSLGCGENITSGDNSVVVILEKLEGREFLGEFSGETDKMGCDKPNPVSHVAYSYATHLVDLDDDGRVCKVIAAHDSGTVVNRASIEGQIEGGVTMGLGYALTEDFPLVQGVPKVRFGTLGLLRSTQVPEIESVLCCARGIVQKVEGAVADCLEIPPRRGRSCLVHDTATNQVYTPDFQQGYKHCEFCLPSVANDQSRRGSEQPCVSEGKAFPTKNSDVERPLAWGAKGVGEICSIPTAPAVALAFYNYDGNFRSKLPIEDTIYSRKRAKGC